jgi:hypothetical protein
MIHAYIHTHVQTDKQKYIIAQTHGNVGTQDSSHGHVAQANKGQLAHATLGTVCANSGTHHSDSH